MADPAYRPPLSEAQDVQAQPYDGPNPGGPVSFAFVSGESRVAHVPASENSGDEIPRSESSSEPKTGESVEEEK